MLFEWKGEEHVTWNGMAVQRLRDHSAHTTSPLERDEVGVSSDRLMAAASSGDTARLVALLLEGECVVNEQDRHGNTPLWRAAFFDRPEAVRTLLASRANPDLPNDAGGLPLHAVSARGDHATCAQLLVDSGADSAALNAIGQTALECARLNDRGGVARVLLQSAHQPRSAWRADHERVGDPLSCVSLHRTALTRSL